MQRTAVGGTEILADSTRVIPAANATHRTLAPSHFFTRFHRFVAVEIVTQDRSRLVAVNTHRTVRAGRRTARVWTAEGRFTGTTLEGHTVGLVGMTSGIRT